ncbi:MAG: hypothetical protein V4611_01765 [Patescibacteria group bacterium]
MNKRLKKIVAVAVLTLTPFIFSGATASAQSFTCEIGYTGPDSNNKCISKTQYSCDIENNTDIVIDVDGEQQATSGNVDNSGNTGTGNATSGTVTNSNGTTFNVVITNPQVGEGTCFASTVIPATPVNPATPVTPDTPATPVQPTHGGGAAAAVLPNTSGDTVTPVLLTVAASLAVLSVLGVSGIALYRYYKSL